MKNSMNKKISVFSALIPTFILFGCGMMAGMSGNYNVTQQGGQFSSNPSCSQMNLFLNQNGNQISGQGQNQCFSQTIQGVMNGNGQASVTMTVSSVGMGGQMNWMQNSWNTGCTYQGMLTISGNTISGSLNPTGGNCASQGVITLNGTRI